MNCSADFIAALRSDAFAFGPVGKGKLFYLYEKYMAHLNKGPLVICMPALWRKTNKADISVTHL